MFKLFEELLRFLRLFLLVEVSVVTPFVVPALIPLISLGVYLV